MIRPTPTDAGEFRLRGKDISRLEALSDGVFALAMTLLIVSVEVPGTFDELLAVFRGFPAFAACFAIMIWFWITHHRFFRRFGLNDGMVVFLNSALLFMVLLYVYPLKFVFSLFVAGMTGLTPGVAGSAIRFDQVDDLFVVYSAGFGAVWLVFGLMNLHAYRLRERLELTPVERLLTRAEVGRSIAMIVIALASITVAWFAERRAVSIAGWLYGLIGPVEMVHGWSVERRKKRLLRATGSAGPPSGTGHPPPG